MIEKITSTSKMVAKHAVKNLGLYNAKEPSRMDLNIKEYYLRIIFYISISIFSLFTLMPYAYYKYSYYKYQNVYIDNKKVVFNGKLSDFYYSFAIGFILFTILLVTVNKLSIIILPNINIPDVRIKNLIATGVHVLPTILFTALIVNRFYRWQQTNIHFVGDLVSPSHFEIHLLLTLLYAIINRLINLFTFGFGRPATVKLKYFYLINRQFCSEIKLKFNGPLITAYSWLFWRYILIFPTFGFYLPIYLYRKSMWIAKYTHISETQKHANHIINII